MTCYQIILVSWKIALNGAYQSHMTISYLCAFPSPPSNLEIAFRICLKDACTYTCEHRQLVLLKASRKIFLVAPGGAEKGRGWCEGCECWCEMSVNRVWVVGGSVSTPCLLFWGCTLHLRAKWDFGPFWLLLLFSDKTKGTEERNLSAVLGVDGTAWGWE